MAERKIPAPEPNPETEAFWAACNDGKLMIGKCNDTGKTYWYPRTLSPFTLSDNTTSVQASGNGKIYSYSVMRRSPEPYCIAYVTLDEGTTMMTNIVDCDFDSLKVGQSVKLVFKDTEGGKQKIACFTPA